MHRRCGLLARVAALILLLLPLQGIMAAETDAASATRIRVALVTAAPGSLYWERFGHNAILIEDTTTGEQRMYNFGWFDFEQENFMLNFIRGRMRYQLAVTDPRSDLANYQAEDRSVWLQELDLDPGQAAQLAARLAHDALPEYAEYRYDYYQNNCSTKVRDALDAVLGGAISSASEGRGRGETWRSLSLVYAEPIDWLALGIHLGLGPAADRRINFWEEAFLPLRLRDLVRDVAIADPSGQTRPLVRAERVVFAGSLTDQLPQRPRWFWTFLVMGIGFSFAIFLALRSRRPILRKAASLLASGVELLIGLIGLGLLGLWFGTDHEIAWRNANIGLFQPLGLLLVPAIWRLRDPGFDVSKPARWIAAVVFASALLTLTAWLLKINGQSQGAWMALCLPWHLLVLLALQRDSRNE